MWSRSSSLGARSPRWLSRACSSTVADGGARRCAHVDVLVVGGGVVGSAAARALSSVPGLSVGLATPRAPRPFGIGDDAAPHARSYALSPASLRVLGDDVVERVRALGRVAPYDRVQVWEDDGPAVLRFSAEDDLEHPDDDVLGVVVEDGPLVSALWESTRMVAATNDHDDDDEGVRLYCPYAVEEVRGADGAGAAPLTVTLRRADGEANGDDAVTVTTSLLVGADGANSSVRDSAGVSSYRHDYDRTAVTCTLRVDGSMSRTAFQRFLPDGPIALLPVWDEDRARNDDAVFANVVWSTTPAHAARLVECSEDDFAEELDARLRVGPTPTVGTSDFSSVPILSDAVREADRLLRAVNQGLTVARWNEDPAHSFFQTPPRILDVVGPRFQLPLRLAQATSYAAHRVALVGDAAHTLHPMAGQGLNLGLGDVRTLVEEVRNAVASGSDFGERNNLFLRRYEGRRQVASTAVMAGVQFLHEAFRTRHDSLRNVRSLGMNLVGAAGPVRRRLAAFAAHGGGGVL